MTYQEAHAALRRRSYADAAAGFDRVAHEPARSALAPKALYWAAFARYHVGGVLPLRTALALLDTLGARHSKGRAEGDADALRAVILGALGQLGDPDATRRLEALSGELERCDRVAVAVRTAELDGLARVDTARAMAIVRRIVSRHECPPSLRRNALFVAATHSPGALDGLLRVAMADPDAAVRAAAVYWTGQMPASASVAVLDSIARHAREDGVRQAALAALADHAHDDGRRALRHLAGDAAAPSMARRTALVLLGERGGPDDVQALRELARRPDLSPDRETAYGALARAGGVQNAETLMGIARDSALPPGDRRTALVLASQTGIDVQEIIRFYDRVAEPLLKEAALAMLAERGEPSGITKLEDVAARERDPRLRRAAVALLAEVRGRPLPQDAVIP